MERETSHQEVPTYGNSRGNTLPQDFSSASEPPDQSTDTEVALIGKGSKAQPRLIIEKKREEPKGLIRLFWRSIPYFIQGSAVFLIPLTILGMSSAIWINIKEVPFVLQIFPHLWEFEVFMLFVGTPLGTVTGWWLLKKSYYFSEQQKIVVEANPYMIWKLTEKEKMLWPITYASAKFFKAPSENIVWMEEVARRNGVKLD